MEIIFIYVVFEDEGQAEAISEELVESGLAACVNILPAITSIYKWEGKMQKSAEVAAFVKTRKDLFEAVRDKVKALHSYDCPCIVAFDVAAGDAGFMEWVEKQAVKAS